ncbi:MAG: hypothetical protein H7263_15590 [Candidatus Sericytochromatia bacterium]|nr:hypothetical protein [Candidatus Sericytochromatia bacterium]
MIGLEENIMSGVTGAGRVPQQQPERTTVANTAAVVAGAVTGAVLLPVALVAAAAGIATESVLRLTNSSAKSTNPANVVSFVDSTEKSVAKAASVGASVVKGAADNIGDAAKIAEKAIEHVAHNILNFLRGNPEAK